MPAAPLVPGSLIDGYTLVERLPAGGMGSIWRATKPGIGYPLILKIPFLDPGEDVSTIIGFEVEEMILKRLSGPHVPRFAGSGDLDAIPYIAMEFVEGENLKDEVERGPFSWQTVAILGCQVASALDSLHRQHVVHLDLKPGNVILAKRGAVLIDFGLARHDELPDLFGEESVRPMGTPAYIAPEQVLGDRSNPASDLFALGCILYELTTGERPFGDPTTKAGLERRIYQAPAPPRSLSRDCPYWLQEVILRSMEVDPARRYASAAQLMFDLNNPAQVVLTEGARRARPEGIGGRIWQALFARKPKAPPFTVTLSTRLAGASVVLAAVDLSAGADALAEEVRGHVARVLDQAPGARLACLTVLKVKIAGEDEAVDAAGRSVYVGRLVALKDWARPLGLDEEKVSYHVVEAVDPASAILAYAARNKIDHIVLGARGSSALRRHLGSVSAQVVAEALCSVTVVRRRRSENEMADDAVADTDVAEEGHAPEPAAATAS
jgi:nucleotide-binding universal stress UspA family protein